MSQQYDYIIAGHGRAATAVLSVLSPHLAAANKTALIVSKEPTGGYDRNEVSKSCLNPDAACARDSSSAEFAWYKDSEGANMDPAWYKSRESTITVLSSVEVVDCNFEGKSVRLSDGSEAAYGKLVVATGASSRAFPACEGTNNSGGQPGFGSVHTIDSMADSELLLAAMQRIEDDDQATNYDPVVVIGSDYLALETASSIAENSRDLHVTVVMEGGWFMEDRFTRSMSRYYERQLSQRYGVRFARNFKCEGLWPVGEEGNFCSVDGPAMNLGKTRPRVFGAAAKQFTECRGVKLSAEGDDTDVRLPARFVVLRAGVVANSSAFQGLDRADDGCIKVDKSFRTSDKDVFAVGDVAVVADGEGNATRRGCYADTGRKMGELVGRVLAGDKNVEGLDSTVPFFTSKVLDFGYKFYGQASGEIVTIDLEQLGEEKADPSTWAAFYVNSGVIVGVHLENGSDEQNSKLEKCVREQPRVLSVKHLAKKGIDEILDNPHLLTPPVLTPGEFHAESDVEMIQETFAQYEKEPGCGTVRVELLGELMAALGADFDEEEIKDACAALDDRKLGVVGFNQFLQWWTN
jgi:NADPH-dependent 2,4-dienoyl-CoA reductase/sulfur reductase-like enzyme